MNYDDELCDFLRVHGVEWTLLDESARQAAERRWRNVYANAFAGRPRLRQGARAEHAYLEQICNNYQIVPFASNVEGLPIHVTMRLSSAFDCTGPLIPLGAFRMSEFFIAPIDFAWTMVHTHEDHGFSGPFFVQRDWL